MSSSEFNDWLAYYALEPFGDQRQDMRFWRLGKTIEENNPYRSRGSFLTKFTDWLPFNAKKINPKKRQSADDMAVNLMATFGLSKSDLRIRSPDE